MNAITEQPIPTTEIKLSQPASPPSRPWHRRIARPLLVSVAMIALIGTGTWWFTEGRWIESTDNAYIRGDIAVLAPRIDGEIASVDVSDNQFVHAGDPLITLDPSDWRVRLAQSTASLAEAEAAVATINQQIIQQQSTIAVTQAAITQADVEQRRASADADRSMALTASGWASRQANEHAVADRGKATAALAAAQAQQAAAEQQLPVLRAQAQQAEARRMNAAATVALAENNLRYTVIRAPFDGIVGNRAVEPGQHVSPGTQVIALAPPPAELFAVANFKETQLRHMRAGMKVRLIPDIDPGAAVDGRVDSIAPATGALFSLLPPENATGNFTKVVQRVPVKIALDPDQAAHAGWLRAGLSVTAEVDTRGPNAERLGLFGAAAHGTKDLVP